jgi:hypothetical protein
MAQWARMAQCHNINLHLTISCSKNVSNHLAELVSAIWCQWLILFHDEPYFFITYFHIWSIALYGAETWTLRTVDQKHLESSEMLCWRRVEKISWTDNVRNEKVLLRVKEQRNILHEICKRKANWIGHILRRNCLLQRVIEVTVQGVGGG